MAAGQNTLAEAYPSRFLLGLGVSHVPLVEQLRGHRYDKPVATMRSYLDAMDQADYPAASPGIKPLRVLAALGPQMLRLAAERADGAHPGFSESDFANGGSDRLIDAVIAWGDLKTVLSRIEEHRNAGADHVCIQVLTECQQDFPLSESRTIAAALRPA